MRALFAELSSETMLADRAEITVVAQKTVTNADIIALNRLCSGKVATVASLIMNVDPAEGISDLHLLTKALQFLLRDIIDKLKSGIDKFTKESITLYLTSPFRQMPRSPLARESSIKEKSPQICWKNICCRSWNGPYQYMNL